MIYLKFKLKWASVCVFAKPDNSSWNAHRLRREKRPVKESWSQSCCHLFFIIGSYSFLGRTSFCLPKGDGVTVTLGKAVRTAVGGSALGLQPLLSTHAFPGFTGAFPVMCLFLLLETWAPTKKKKTMFFTIPQGCKRTLVQRSERQPGD